MIAGYPALTTITRGGQDESHDRQEGEKHIYTLQEVVLPESLKIIGDEAFGETGIKKVTIPVGVERIGYAPFTYSNDEYGLEHVHAEMVISKDNPFLYSDGRCVFRRNDDGTQDLVLCFKTGLTKYDVPAGTARIYAAAFLGCKRLTTLTLNEGLRQIGSEAVRYCSQNMRSIALPDSVEDITDLPFTTRTVKPSGYYSYLDDLTFKIDIEVSGTNPHFLKDGAGLYARCDSGRLRLLSCGSDADRLDIKAGTVALGDRAFDTCRRLKEITVPDSLEEIEAEDLSEYFPPTLKNIEVSGANADFSSDSGALYDADRTKLLFVPKKLACKELRVPGTVQDIGTAFARCEKIGSLVLPEGLTGISKNAFLNAKICSFTVPASVKDMYEEKGNGSFDPNKLPQQLISAVKALTKDEIYHDVLKQAVNSKACGRHLIAPKEETVKQPIVKAPSNIPDSDSSDIELAISGLMDIELSGTKYEGRGARIENVKVGDIVQLVREPDNPYDSNAIDVRNAAGSLGHIPSDIAELLAKRLDSGAVTAKAVVTEVLPKSQRGKGAKKAVLKIRLNSDATGEEKPKYDRKGKSPAPSQNAPKGKDGRKNKPSGKKPAPSSSAKPKPASAQKPAEETPEQKRERFYKRRREELRRELEKAQKELEPQEKKAEEERQKELAEYIAIQKELEGLGAFSFLKKSALRARLEAMGPAMESAQKMRDLHLLAPRKKVERLRSRIDMIGTVKGEIEEIYDVIYFHGPITAQDIENHLSVLFEGSTRYISHIRRLVSDGRVIREEIHGKTVYSAVKF